MTETYEIGCFNGPEKRTMPRCFINNKVLWRMISQEEAFEGRSRDLSVCGICLQIQPDQMVLDRCVKITILFPLGETIALSGNIRWSRTLDGRRYVGIVFEEITTLDKEVLLKKLYEHRKEDIVNHWFSGWNDNGN